MLDIKPYVPAFDAFPDARAGWMDLINPAAEDARLTGYQTIRSPRGERAARYRLKQTQQTEGTVTQIGTPSTILKQESEEEEVVSRTIIDSSATAT